FLEDAVHLFNGGVTRSHEGQVDHGNVDGRHAHGEAIELACQLGQHQAHGSGSTRAGGDHALGGRTGATQVAMVDVGQHLVVRVGMDGGHQTRFHTQLLMQGFDQRGQAVGGAGSVGNDGVGGLQHVVVHAVHDGGVNVLAARCGNDHLL